MSNKKRHTSNNRRKRSKPATRWTHRIFVTARLADKSLKRGDEDAHIVAEARLSDLVADALDAGAEKQVLRAIEDLDEAGLDEAAENVAFHADNAASCMPVIFEDKDGEVFGEVELLLVPMFLISEPGQPLTDKIPGAMDDTQSVLGDLAASLHQHDLIGPASSVFLCPWLYAYADLPDTLSGQRVVVRQMADGFQSQENRMLRPAHTHESALGEDEVATAIRFAMVAVFSPFGSDIRESPLLSGFFGEDDFDDDDIDALVLSEVHPSLLAWQEEVEQILTQHLPGVMAARIGKPDWWQEAIHAGFDLRNMTGLIMTVAADRSPENIREKLLATQASVGCYLVDGVPELRIGIAQDGEFVDGFVWNNHQDLDVEMQTVRDILLQIGVPPDQIRISEMLLGDERCPDSVEPHFPNFFEEDEGLACTHNDSGGHILH